MVNLSLCGVIWIRIWLYIETVSKIFFIISIYKRINYVYHNFEERAQFIIHCLIPCFPADILQSCHSTVLQITDDQISLKTFFLTPFLDKLNFNKYDILLFLHSLSIFPSFFFCSLFLSGYMCYVSLQNRPLWRHKCNTMNQHTDPKKGKKVSL